MSKDHLLTAAVIVLITSFTLHWRKSPIRQEAWQPILEAVRHECDPTNFDADYSFAQKTLPTERKRAALLQRCLELGPGLLPWIKDAIQHETDEEVRGMLTVFAAALGDTASIELAARCMTGRDFPALKITAAKALLPIRDPRLIAWFRLAMNDWHFVVNGDCGLQREQFYPVRAIAAKALRMRNLPAESYDQMLARIRSEQLERIKQLEREILQSK
ncbi:MAG: hypothetical protein IPK22_09190 [Verrucomicrobiaceae bacterium]|nr:hypothetical protein [Verrucomicrobiaceae bacterium]